MTSPHYRSISPLPPAFPTCGGVHLHCPACGHPVRLWLAGKPLPLRHQCAACGSCHVSRGIQFGPA